MLKRSVGANTLRKLGDSATRSRAARGSLLDGGVPEHLGDQLQLLSVLEHERGEGVL